MKARHGGEDVGVLAVDAVEEVDAHHGIPSSQSRHVARCMEDRRETVVHGVPWWSSRVHIVPDEAYEVGDEKCPCEARHPLVALSEIEVQREHYRHRHPAEVEQAAHEVEDG